MPVQSWLHRQSNAYEELWQSDSILTMKKTPAGRLNDLDWATNRFPRLQRKRSLTKKTHRGHKKNILLAVPIALTIGCNPSLRALSRPHPAGN